MAGATARAWMLARGQPQAWRRQFVAAVGFTLIALFDGFAIITALDAGAPGWAVAVIAVAAVLGQASGSPSRAQGGVTARGRRGRGTNAAADIEPMRSA